MSDPLSTNSVSLTYCCPECGFRAEIEPRFMVPGVIEYPTPVCLADNLAMYRVIEGTSV